MNDVPRNRAERRRNQRLSDRAASRRQPVIIAGDGVVATALGHQFEARPSAQLPAKQPGRHRWIATAGYVVDVELVRAADDPNTLKFLDHENLWSLAIGCVDCEQVLGVIGPDTVCPAGDWTES